MILSHFGYTNEDGMILNDTFCGNLVLPHLTDLQLDHGGIYDIRSDLETGCFSNLTNLRMLNLSFNHMSLSRINLYSSIGEISNPFELDVSHQNAITEYDDTGLVWLSSYTNLEKLDISFVMNSGNGPNRPVTLEFDSLKYLKFQGNFVRVLKIITPRRNSSDIYLRLISLATT